MTLAVSAQAQLCRTVDTDTVGDKEIAHYKHSGNENIETIVVLRRSDSNLCPSHAAVGLLLAGDQLIHGLLSEAPFIQINVRPGEEVVAVVLEVRIDDDVMCIEHGELSFTIEECQLE